MFSHYTETFRQLGKLIYECSLELELVKHVCLKTFDTNLLLFEFIQIITSTQTRIALIYWILYLRESKIFNYIYKKKFQIVVTILDRIEPLEERKTGNSRHTATAYNIKKFQLTHPGFQTRTKTQGNENWNPIKV